ncbi:Embryogenesis-associated protein [Actinidia chinensis var. chinensis]|uniref:Embryogenesis-associated protein n=1 Tax=Actinidia chinensis var. chinensis TaxID=1590841 RepID=A0A2R6Q6K4_ACTCC|nr:Embryogenesis-associated protein [Actinidia chinensis var. chinensis]
MDCSNSIETCESPYQILLIAASLIPIYHYLLGFLFIFLVFLYNFFEIHILRDLLTGFRGQPVSLTFNSCSEVYQDVVSKCRILHGRYLATPWLSSPHFQTSFLSFFGRPPAFHYRRQLFHTPDGGTMALDWLVNSDDASFEVKDVITKHDKTPIVIVIPGLTSDSSSAYIKHFAFKVAKCGWNVVVTNHRGLGGISITSDCFYNAGWTEDIRKIIDHLHYQYPEAPLFVVGTSIGANILVKYLGEDGINTPVAGAAAVCSPWDLLICDRFINRRMVQKFYDKALIMGLKGYAQLHQLVLSRLADWEGILKVTCILFLISSYPHLHRANKNIVLATTQHGGHLAFYEGITAKSIWWVRAVHEFFSVLQTSSLIHRKKEAEIQVPHSISPQESSIDQAPHVNITEDGMVTAMGNEQTNVEDAHDEPIGQNEVGVDKISETHRGDQVTGERTHLTDDPPQPQGRDANDINIPVRTYMDRLSRHSRKSIWLLAYIAIITTWPLVGPALSLLFKKRIRNALPAVLKRK